MPLHYTAGLVPLTGLAAVNLDIRNLTESPKLIYDVCSVCTLHFALCVENNFFVGTSRELERAKEKEKRDLLNRDSELKRF